MDVGLTRIDEKAITKHRSLAQSLITRFSVLEQRSESSDTQLAGTRRRMVSTVSTAGLRKTRQVELMKAIAAVRADDAMLSPRQHTLAFKARRGIAIALAVCDVFARQAGLDSLMKKNASSPLEGGDAQSFKALLSASAYIASFSFVAYLGHMIESDLEPGDDLAEPDYAFDTPQDA